jgi:hypothetical protein
VEEAKSTLMLQFGQVYLVYEEMMCGEKRGHTIGNARHSISFGLNRFMSWSIFLKSPLRHIVSSRKQI